MESNRHIELITKYNEGLADQAEIKRIEHLIEAGEIQLSQLHDLSSLESRIQAIEVEIPTMKLDDTFYHQLKAAKKTNKNLGGIKINWNFLFPRLVAALILMLMGYSAGFFMYAPSTEKEISKLTSEVSELKEMMMLSLLEKESAAQRLKAVSLTAEMNQVSDKITDALLTTLTHDENVNVRLAALEALKPYVKDSIVRTRLIESIALQESPLVQLAMAELMVSMQEKKSVNALKRLLESDNTPSEVKARISESIEVLI